MYLSQQFFKVNILNKHKILHKLPKNRVELHLFENIDSTNEECKRIAQKKDFHVVVSEKQTMGKGRLGKNWSSPSSGNVYMSIYSQELPNNIPLSLLVGLICTETLNLMIKNDSIGLKWPNDMLLDKKKIGGILVEKEIMGKNINSIVGIGINLNHPEKEDWWGDLYKFGIHLRRDELINKIIHSYIQFYDNGISNWQELWHKHCVHLNYEIKIKQNNKVINEGVFTGINADGSLNLKMNNSKETKYEYGEISIEGIY
jgi:BirA family biotin operon repressor/biotin-[acetyl-CoA-carboxylase] ligase